MTARPSPAFTAWPHQSPLRRILDAEKPIDEELLALALRSGAEAEHQEHQAEQHQ
jgi:hypothetical protein